MSKKLRILLIIGGVTAALPTAGCGKRELSTRDTVPVQGRATLGGEPIRYAIVEFTPSDPAKGIPASGRTDSDGYFQLWTYGNEGPDGAVPGVYNVTFDWGGAKPIGGVAKDQPGPTLGPPDLGDITIEIQSGGGEIEIAIQ